ncbi:hypothetical protein BC829DRAFT_391404 [Chytridium lagenaria]|nr:hypothetical protein BC829DRAFT_391404 [Chytridium lagenaria]
MLFSTAIRAIDSTSTTLSLSLDVTITLDPLTDITPTTLPFTFGSSTDPTLTFGTGVLAVTPNGFCSNAVSEISVSQEGSETPFVVAVNGVGVSIVEQLIVFVTLRTPVTKQSQSQIKIFNPFLLPLTFTGLTATAIAQHHHCALLGAFQRAGNALPVMAKASSQVLIGEFPADVTFEQVIPASIGTN